MNLAQVLAGYDNGATAGADAVTEFGFGWCLTELKPAGGGGVGEKLRERLLVESEFAFGGKGGEVLVRAMLFAGVKEVALPCIEGAKCLVKRFWGEPVGRWIVTFNAKDTEGGDKLRDGVGEYGGRSFARCELKGRQRRPTFLVWSGDGTEETPEVEFGTAPRVGSLIGLGGDFLNVAPGFAKAPGEHVVYCGRRDTVPWEFADGFKWLWEGNIRAAIVHPGDGLLGVCASGGLQEGLVAEARRGGLLELL